MAGKVKLDPASVLPPLFSASKDHFVTFKFLLWPPHYVETEDLLIDRHQIVTLDSSKVSPWIPLLLHSSLGELRLLSSPVERTTVCEPGSQLSWEPTGVGARSHNPSACRPLTCE